MLKLKGMRARQDKRSKPDTETSHAPTTQDNSGAFYSRYTFMQGKKRGVTLGSCGKESRGQVRLILRNTEGLYTTALQLLTNTMSHVR
jgi:hypothetical protein